MALTPSSPLDKDLYFILDGFREILHKNLYDFWKTSQLCDLTLQMSEGVIHVHSCLLAAFSPTIAEMISSLDSYFNEKGKRSQKIVTIEVVHFSLNIMKSIVSSIYTGRLETSSKNIKDLLDAVRWLGIEDLVSAIEQTISEDDQITANVMNEKTEDDRTDLFKVVIGNDSVRNTFYEDKTIDEEAAFLPDSKTCSSQSLPKFSSDLTLESHQSSSISNSSNVNNKKSHSKKKKSSNRTSSFPSELNENLKDKTIEFAVPSITAEINDPSDFLALSDQVNFIHDQETEDLTMCQSDDQKDVANSMHVDINPTGDIHADMSNGTNKADKENVNEQELADDEQFPHKSKGSQENNAVSQTGVRKSKRAKKRKKPLLLQVSVKKLLNVSENVQLSPEILETDSAAINMTVNEKETTSQGAEESVTESVKRNNVTVPLNDLGDRAGNYKCDKCLYTFDDIEVYHQHRKKHPAYSCEKCPKSFLTKRFLKRHFTVYHQKQHLICEECSFQASTTKELCGHSLKEHDQPRPFTCKHPGCGYRTDRSYVLENHIKRGRHSEVDAFSIMKERDKLRPYKCPKCLHRYKDLDEYNEHFNNHPEFSCQECQETFFTKNHLTRHRFVVHLQNKHLICDECSFQAKTGKELCNHTTKEHNQPKPFKCKHPGCSFRSNIYYNIENHMDSCHNEDRKPRLKSHMCKHCGKRFAKAGVLDDHVRSCLRLEEYLCDLCGEAFNRKRYLEDHRNVVHFKIKKYKCNYCLKTFGRRTQYKNHVLLHKHAYPYPCLYCSQAFRFKSHRRKHVEDIHKDMIENSPKVILNYKGQKNDPGPKVPSE